MKLKELRAVLYVSDFTTVYITNKQGLYLTTINKYNKDMACKYDNCKVLYIAPICYGNDNEQIEISIDRIRK